ncbi:hypothetical protein LZP46_01035 [Acinetobacter sp. SCLZS86]|uniref:hypothetical protein n=1 Tax=Acinetobacter sp. SCLZS86 TaxID=2908637 RepID=UPI001F291967|nr:hypothetical protein [Acinetobacter sp. SCLZS86]UIZ57772.1 hypothetical protein LZP46_01035 [Acinetobacter sp. SCLZS86]
MWIQIALFIVSLVVSYALQPKPQRPKAAAFEEFDFPTVEDGTPQIVVFGDVWLTDWTVLGVGNYRTSNIVAKQKGLFGSKKTTTGYRYHMSLHMGLCRGMDDLVEIKVGDRTAWTGSLASSGGRLSIKKPDLFGGDKGEGGINGSLIVSYGRPDQHVLTELSAIFGVVPAYRGVVTFFYDGLVCSNSPYPKPWSFRVRRVTSDWDGAVWYADKAVIWLEDNKIKAMNPAHILYEVQTNTLWGRGFSAGQLDLDSFKAAADQLYNEKFGVCLAWRRQDSLNNFIQQILDQIGAALYVDRTTGLWRLTLIRDNYQLESLPQYSYQNGLLRIEEDNNAALDLVTNQVVVTFKDPIKNQDETIRAENIAAIQKHGLISENKSYAGIPTANLAGRIAARDMKIAQSNLKKFKLIFDRRAYAMQPASVFKLALPERGITSIIVRAIRVEHNDATNGEITVTVVQDVFGLPSSNFIQSQPSLWQPPDLTAKPVSQQLLYEVPFAELLREFSIQELQQIQNQSYVGVVAQQPTAMHLDFDIFAKASTDAVYIDAGNGEFGFVSEIDADIAQTAEPITCNLNRPIDDAVQVGDRAFLGNEIVRIESINRETNSLVLARGCIDTVPFAHNAQTLLWVYSNIASVAESTFASTQTVDMKLVTHVSQDVLNQDLATVASLALNNRKERPYPPANVKINKAYFPQEITGDVNVSWSHRNRMQTGLIPAFTTISNTPEENTKYNLRIYDANNVKLFESTDLDVTEYTWAVPKIFAGEMEVVLDLPMTGVNNGTVFNDVSSNQFAVSNNFNVLTKTDVDAVGGSSAYLDRAVLKTTEEHQKLDIYSEDHCIEFRVKTAHSGDYLGTYPDILYLSISHQRIGFENISVDYLISIQSYEDKITIEVTGTKFTSNDGRSGTALITFNAEGLNSDTYYDISIQCTKSSIEIIGGAEIKRNLIQIFVAGEMVHSGVLDTHSHGYKCGLRLNLSANGDHGGKTALNGLRITKRSGGRYSGNYIPAQWAVGSSDPYWNDVVLLLPMTGTNNGHIFNDVSLNPVTMTATDTVLTKSDSKATGGSATYFYRPALVVESQEILNLKDKSFIIEGRIKTGEGNVFKITDSMDLSVNQYQLRLSNYEMPEPQTVILNLMAGIDADWRADRYFTFKIIRDAVTGITTLWFDNKYTSGQFNPSFVQAPSLVICPKIISHEVRFNGIRIHTADATAVLVPNVVNPLRIELESQRGALKSYQMFSTTLQLN